MSGEDSSHVTTTTEPESVEIDATNCASVETENASFNETVTQTERSELEVKEAATKLENNIKDEVKETIEEADSKLEDNTAHEVKVTENEVQEADRKSVESECIPYTEIKIKDEDSSSTAHKVVDSLAYRVEDDGSESEDSSDDSDDSDDNDDSSRSSTPSISRVEKKKEILSKKDDKDNDTLGKKKKGCGIIRTRGELYPEELPPLEELKISVEEDVEMQEVGKVASTVGVLVVVQADKDIPALNEETVLFTENRQAFGKIFEVFGPVASPFYSVRFNSPEDIVNKEISVGLPLYCAPKKQEYTQFVFVEQLKRIKGSDASWENNNEPPSTCLDFSDDEDEIRMKAKNRNKAPVEGATDDQVTNNKGPNKKKHARFENKMGNNKEHNKEHSDQKNMQGGRGRRHWPPKQNDSWPPPDSSSWPPRAEESWSPGQGDGNWMNAPRQFSPRGQTPRPFLSSSNFPGGRGMNRHPGVSLRFQNPFQQSQMRGGPLGGPQGPPSHHGGPQGPPSHHGGPQGPPSHHGIPNYNFRDNSFQGHSQGFSQEHVYDMGTNYNTGNGNILMDTRLVQNPNHDVEAPPFGMTRPPHPRSTFGGQPQFTPGPMGGQYNQRPGMPGIGKFNNGQPGRW